MSSYTNTHTNHTDDTSKKWPIVIPWDASAWDANLNFVGDKIKSSDLRELRQHAKALEANFNFAGTDPNYNRVNDTETATNEVAEAENLNQTPGTLTAQGAGLLDGIKTIKPTTGLAAILDGQIMSKATMKAIATELNGLKSYANYSNYNNAGYGQYSALESYVNTNVYSNYGQYNEYNRSIHSDHDGSSSRYNRNNSYSQANVYTNQTAPGYENGVANRTVAYSNAVYSNAFANPASYQNNL